MKDEEMAEEYTAKNGFGSDCNNLTSYDANKEIEQAFLAGLKAGRPQWHDLRKDKNDLPKNSPYFRGQSVRVTGAIPLSDDKYMSIECRYYFSEKKWKTQEDCSVVKVIAWCEIPTFDKE